MAIIVVLVFLGVFRGCSAVDGGERVRRFAAGERELLTRLESALAVGKPENADLIVDIRKNELMSSIPWLDRWLRKIELAPRLRRLLYPGQFEVDCGRLVLIMRRLLCSFPHIWFTCELTRSFSRSLLGCCLVSRRLDTSCTSAGSEWISSKRACQRQSS